MRMMDTARIEENIKQLRKQIGAYAVRRLRMGKASVHYWRGSTPHNCWVQGHPPRRQCWLWHSDGWDWPGRRDMYELVGESNDRVKHSLLHRDGGHPFESVYVLKPEYRIKPKRRARKAKR